MVSPASAMLRSLLAALVLLRSARCDPSPALSTAGPELEPLPVLDGVASPAQEDYSSGGTIQGVPSTVPPTEESVIRDRKAAEPSAAYQSEDASQAKMAEAMADIANSLRAVHEALMIFSDRLGLIQESQIVLKDNQLALTSRLEALQKVVSQIPRRALGDPCHEDADCSEAVLGAVCSGVGRCVCRGDLRQVSATVCRSSPRLSEPCQADRDCQTLTPAAVCAGGVCSCPESHWETDDGTECRLKQRRLGLPCQFDPDCSYLVTGAVCDPQGVCACGGGFRQATDTFCRLNALLSSACTGEDDCHTVLKNGTCVSGVCGCRHDQWLLNGTECREIGGEGESCAYTDHCLPGMVCWDGSCSCPVVGDGALEMRLSRTTSCSVGVLEVREVSYFGTVGEWGLICDRGWDHENAQVACQHMGFVRGRALPSVHRASESSKYLLKDVYCTGRGLEFSLLDCRNSGWGDYSCRADGNDAATVNCSN